MFIREEVKCEHITYILITIKSKQTEVLVFPLKKISTKLLVALKNVQMLHVSPSYFLCTYQYYVMSFFF